MTAMGSPAPRANSGAAACRRFLATAGGLGRLPLAPGTWGSLGTILLLAPVLGVAGVLPGLLPANGTEAWMLVLGAVLVITVVGIVVGHHAQSDFGVTDPGAFVLDEVAGQLIAVLPLLPGPAAWWELALAFGAFRLFDVTKPPPCRRLESLRGGVGIMADDVAAGIFAAGLLLLVRSLV